MWPNLCSWGLMLQAIRSLFEPLYLNVQFDLTNACNLRCTHCYHPNHLNNNALTVEEWIKVTDEVKTFSFEARAVPVFFICGGEPTLAESFARVLRKIRSDFPKAEIVVLTNGTTLTRPLPGGGTALSLICEVGAQVQVSLDGATATYHDSIRGVGNFDKAVSGVMLLRQNGITVLLQSVLSRITAGQIPDFFRLASELNVQVMNFIRLVEEGMAVKYVAGFGNQSPHLTGEELRSAMNEILKNSKHFKISTSTDGPLWALIDPKLGSAARLGFYEMIVDYQGYLKVSSRTSIRLGHVLRDGIWNSLSKSKIVQDLRRGDISGCKDCSLFHAKKCSGDRNIAFAATGTYLGPDVGCWKWIAENEESKNYFRASVSVGRGTRIHQNETRKINAS